MKWLFLLFVSGSIILYFISNQSPKLSFSTWAWNIPSEIQIISASSAGVTKIYLDISDYSEREFDEPILATLASAKKNKIAIEAMIAHPNWSNPDYKYIPLDLIKKVSDFNKSNPEIAFSGIHYDIEFYSNPEYKTTQSQFALYFLELLNESVDAIKLQPNLAFSLSLPPWLATQGELSSPVKWSGKTNFILPTVAKTIEPINGTIVLMAYRNQAQKVYDASVPALESVKGINANVLVAIETASNTEPGTSYFGSTRNQVISEANHIINLLQSNYPKVGFAIHSLESFQALK